MIPNFDVEVARLTDTCHHLFGDESRWIEPDGYRDSLALCIIDSIFSTGSHYTSVINVVSRYCAYRRQQGADPYRDGPDELLATFSEVGDSREWAKAVVGNYKPAHTRPGAPLKAEVVYQTARALKMLQLMAPQDVQKAFAKDESFAALKKTWLKLPSQSSGITFDYFLILVCLQSVKPDRMVVRFIREHTSINPSDLDTASVSDLIKQVAAAYPTQVRKLDHVIWRYVSGRRLFVAQDQPEIGEA
ncbi:hypothetical protein [Sinomonas sp.]|uniref:hypothetical protein n=1 Tax=Sinomonas sp. TaxID=1914986 RepID=UPI003F80185E